MQYPAQEEAEAPDPASGQASKGAAASDGMDWAKENEKNRTNATAFIKEGFLAVIVVLFRYVLSPMMKYLHTELKMSSTYWEQAQRRQSMETMSAAGLLGGRKWPILRAATGEVDNECMKAIEDLHQTPWSEAAPKSWLTVKWRNILFRLLSREAAMIYMLLVMRHETFPFLLFLLLVDPAYADIIKGMCESSYDEFTAGFIAHYKDHGGIDGPRALLELAVIAIIVKTSTVRIEVLNGKLRKILRTRSNQTARPDLGVVSAEFLLSRVRARETRWKRNWKVTKKRKVGGKGLVRKRSTRKAIQPPKRKRGGGGAWRAYVSARCRDKCKAVMKDLAR